MEKIIFDCDNTMGLPFKEVDDGLTILYLLGEPSLQLIGITTTFGNGTLEQVYPQTQKLIKRLQLDIPVLKGEGECGQAPDTPAAEYLVEMVNRYPHEVSVLATGPLGNLHAAVKIDPRFFQKVKRIALMGGYLEPVILGRRDLDELNLSANPKASLSVLSAPADVTLFPAQVCLEAPYRLKNILKAKYWPLWFKGVLGQWLLAFGYHTGEMIFYLWDLLPAVFLVESNIFTFSEFALASTINDMRHGMLISNSSSKKRTIPIATTISDLKGFYQRLGNAWQRTMETYPFHVR